MAIFAISIVAGEYGWAEEESSSPMGDAASWTSQIFEEKEAATSQDDMGILGFDSKEYFSRQAEEEEGVDDEPYEDFVRQRRRLVIREFRHNADWNTDPTALPALIDQFKRRTGMEAYTFVPREPLDWNDEELFKWPLVYTTGHNAFTMTEEDAANVRRYLKNGGFLFIDDCLYGFPFGKAVHSEFKKVFPNKTFERIDHTEDVYKNIFQMKYSWDEVNEAGLPMKQRPHFWEAIFVNGHIRVLYTPQDLGCQWEISSPPTPSNPLGGGMHNWDRINGARETAYQLGVNVLLYVLTH